MKDRLYRISFSAQDLKGIPKAQSGFMIASCLAINDITTFQRLFLMSLNARSFKEEEVDDTVVEYAMTQSLVIQRTLSGKLREYLYMCEQYQNGCERNGDKKMKPFLEKSKMVYSELTAMPGYMLADWYRNMVTHHYILKHISGLLPQLVDEIDYSIYLHRRDGNNGFFLGERVLMHKLEEPTGKDPIDRLNEFQEWVLHSARVVQALHHEFCIQFMETFFPEKKVIEFPVVIPDDMLGQLGEAKLSPFWDFRGMRD